MTSRRIVLLAVVLAVFLGATYFLEGRSVPDTSQAPPTVLVKEVLSDTYQVERKYRSMMGPWSGQEVRLLEATEPELLWIVGYDAVMVGPDGEEPRSQEFMCHSNLDLDPAKHYELFQSSQALNGRLFTLSQGQLSIRLPEGFGIPVLSTEALELTTQVLNLNHENPELQIRHKVSLRFLRDRDLDQPIKALAPQAVYGLASLDQGPNHFGMEDDDPRAEGPGCMVGENASTHEYSDDLGRRFTGHWVVPPGREVNRTQVTGLLDLPYDTTVHYIAVHLHPFAESLELRDLTAGTTVFKSRVRPADEGIGIAHVEYFSSQEGVTLFRGHEYELVSVYNNTSGEEQDSMAVMYMYLLDPKFHNPMS